MRKYTLLIIGIMCLIGSFIWIFASKQSTGPMILGAVSGAIIFEGIARLK
ncbi:MAG: hypothetical protein MJ077_06495 [Oscillospiraceae bacterium]|nr:hypothetical protein [Oscillospiraceae bacterium]